MKKYSDSSKRKGFTLVELLIVIVVIGILSAMMMLSSTEAVTSAKASNIVSNLRNLKTAALAYYTDNIDYFSETKDGKPNGNPLLISGSYNESKKDPKIPEPTKYVIDYLNNGQTLPDAGDYNIIADSTTGSWYLICTITGTTQETERIQEKLKGRASSVGLLNATSASTVTTTTGSGEDATTTGGETYDGTKNFVAIQVR